MFDDLKNIFRGNNFISKIILINAIIFVVYTIIAQFSPAFVAFVSNWFSLSASLSKFIFRPWTIITYMFLHAGIGHVFFNMYIFTFSFSWSTNMSSIPLADFVRNSRSFSVFKFIPQPSSQYNI